jgi:hypothetical protein
VGKLRHRQFKSSMFCTYFLILFYRKCYVRVKADQKRGGSVSWSSTGGSIHAEESRDSSVFVEDTQDGSIHSEETRDSSVQAGETRDSSVQAVETRDNSARGGGNLTEDEEGNLIIDEGPEPSQTKVDMTENEGIQQNK